MENLTTMQQWYHIKQQMAALRDKERELREQLIREFFPESKVGTNNYKLETGATLKLVRSLDYKVNQDELEKHWTALSEATIPMKTLIRFKPEVSVSVYKNLPETQTKALAECGVITIREESPSLSIEPPKASKNPPAFENGQA